MSSKCNGTWIKPYRRVDGTRVGSHCRKSIATVLNDNRKKYTQLRKILRMSTDSLQNIENKLNMVQNPMPSKELAQRMQRTLKMSIPTQRAPELKSILENQIKLLQEQRAHYKNDDSLKDALAELDAKMKLLQEFMVRIDSHLDPSKLNHVKARSEDVEERLEEKKRAKQEAEAMVARLHDIAEKNKDLDQQLTALTKEKHKLLSQVASLDDIKAENDALKNTIQQLEAEGANTKDLTAKIKQQEKYLDQIEALTKAKDDVQAQVDALLNEKAELHSKLNEKELELKHEKELLEKFRTQSNDERASELAQKQAEVEAVRAELAEVKDNQDVLAQKQAELHQHRSDLASSHAELSALRSELDSVKSVSASQRAELAQKEADVVQLSAALKAKQNELEALHAELDAATSKSGSHQQSLAHKQDEVERLMAELDAVKAQSNAHQETLDQKQSEVDDLQSRLESVQRELEHVRSNESTRATEITQKQAQLDALNEQLALSQSELAEARSHMDASVSTMATHQESLAQKQREVDALHAQLSRSTEAEEVRTSMQEKIDALQSELTFLQSKSGMDNEALVNEQQALVAQKEKENQELRDQLVALGTNTEMETLRQQLKEKDDVLNVLKDRESQSRDALNVALQEKNEALERLAVLRKSTAESDVEKNLNQQISDLNGQISALQSEKQILHEDKEKLNQALAEKEARVLELESKVEASDKKYNELTQKLQGLTMDQETLLNSAMDELETKKSELEATLSKVTQEKVNVDAQLKEKTNEIQDLKSKLKLVTGELSTMKVATQTKEVLEQNQKDDLLEQIKAKTKEGGALQTTINQMRTEKEQLETSLRQSQAEYATLLAEKKRLEGVDGANQNLRDEILAKQALIDALTLEKEQLQKDKVNLQANVDNTLDVESETAKDKAALQQQIAELASQHDTDVQRISELDALRLDNQQDKNKIISLTETLDKTALHGQSLVAELDRVKLEVKEVRALYDALEKEKVALLQQKEEANKQRETVVAQMAQLTIDLKSRDEAIHALKETNQRLEEAQSGTMTASMKKLEESLTSKETEVSELKRLVDELNLKLSAFHTIEKAKKEVDEKLAHATVASGQLQSQVADVSGQLASAKEEIALVKNQMEELIQTIEKNKNIALTESQAQKNLASKDKIILDLTNQRDLLQVQVQELQSTSAKALSDLKQAKEKEIDELKELVRTGEERLRALMEASVKQEELQTKNSELEASKASLQAKIDELTVEVKAHQEKASIAPSDDQTNVVQDLADAKQQLSLVNQQLEQANVQAGAQEQLIKKLQDQLEQKDASLQQKISAYEAILSEKENAMAALNEDKARAVKEFSALKTSFDESLEMLSKAAEILKTKPELGGVADTIMLNLEKLKGNVAQDLVDITPIKVSEYEQDKTAFEYVEATAESYDKIYTQYEDILGELQMIQNYYMELLRDVDPKLISQNNTTVQEDKDTSLVIYNFLTTALFHLCKTYLRIPFVLRMLSLPDLDLVPPENTKIKKNIIDSLYMENPALGVEASELNQLLHTINPALYDTYMRKLDSNRVRLRIDVMAYYMLNFMYSIKDTPRTSTENNLFLRMIDAFTQTVLKKLRLIMYTNIGDTRKQLSDLDKIKSQSLTKLTRVHNDSNKVVTFVKIRIDGERATLINKRFQTDAYLLSKSEARPRKELRLKYSDFDYRKGYGEDELGNSDFKNNGFRFYTKNGLPACDLAEIKYNHEFYFGPFSQIYTPDQSALDITRETTFVNSIERKLREGKPVCIIGYGASGSGKTSTLVYLSYYKKGDAAPTTQNGILAELSNKMTDMFDACNIQVYEFEGNIEGDEKAAVKDYLMRKYPAPVTKNMLLSDKKTQVDVYNKPFEDVRSNMDPNDTNNTCFEYEIKTVDNVRQWVKKDTKRYTPVRITEEEYANVNPNQRYMDSGNFYKVVLEPYMSDKEISEDEFKSLKPGMGYELYGKYFKIVPDADKKLIPMASDIANFMDNKRNIAATANNPVSSRSHVVIFINYKESKTNKSSTLVLCDFAGVENKFDCDSESVLSKLATIPTKKTANNKPEEQVPYYESRIADIKRRNYAKLIDNDGPDLLAKASSISSDVNDNISFILKNMAKAPLSNIELKKAETQYQQLYPPNQMVPLDTFMDRLVMIKQIQDKLSQKEIASIMIGSSTIGQWVAAYKKNESYKETKFSASDVIFKLTKNQHGLTSKLITDSNGDWLDIKPLAPIDVTMPGETVFVSKLIYLASTYASELFKKYKSDDERKSGLVVMQYLFEMMAGVTAKSFKKGASDYAYTVDKLASNFAKKICLDRVKEGLYINDSLLQLRKFIGKLVKGQSSGYAPFIDKCLPLQCNPFYKDCFGLNEYDDTHTLADPNMSSLAQQIMKAPNYSDMTFCIMCVVNLSMGANNPPPSPYLDITNLMMEFERLKMVKQQFFMNRAIAQKGHPDQPKSDFNGALLSNANKVDPDILDQIINHPLLTTPLAKNFQDMVRSMVQQLQGLDVTSGDYLQILESLIDEINKSNAITTIGTLQFTDTMAKFGASTMTCNMLAKNKTAYDTNIVKTVNADGAKEIYSSLLLLKTKGVITQEQLEKEFKPYLVLYNPFPAKEKSPVKKPGVVATKPAAKPVGKK